MKMNRVRHAQTNARQMFDPSAALPSTSLSAAEYKETEIKSNSDVHTTSFYILKTLVHAFFFTFGMQL